MPLLHTAHRPSDNGAPDVDRQARAGGVVKPSRPEHPPPHGRALARRIEGARKARSAVRHLDPRVVVRGHLTHPVQVAPDPQRIRRVADRPRGLVRQRDARSGIVGRVEGQRPPARVERADAGSLRRGGARHRRAGRPPPAARVAPKPQRESRRAAAHLNRAGNRERLLEQQTPRAGPRSSIRALCGARTEHTLFLSRSCRTWFDEARNQKRLTGANASYFVWF